jgi:hypothetical protein
MTDVRDYFDTVYPAAVVCRLLRGAGGRRHIALSPGWRHYESADFSHAAGLVRLFLVAHSKHPETGHAVLATFPWQQHFTTLHMGWSLLEHTPLSAHQPHSLDGYAFEIAFDFDLPEVEKKRAHFPIRRGFLCDCGMPESTSGCCRACWLLVRLVRRALDYLTSDSDWGPPLWVFSGGKGAHCFYGSDRARALPKSLREAFAESLKLAPDLANISPAFRTVMLRAWEELGVREQGVLASDRACAVLADAFLVKGSSAFNAFHAAVAKFPTSEMRWRAFVRFGGSFLATRVACELGVLPLDEGPLTQLRGQIKAPFSLHTTSHRVALPLDDAAFATFDPARAPSLVDAPDALRTALVPSVAHLERWLTSNGYGT